MSRWWARSVHSSSSHPFYFNPSICAYFFQVITLRFPNKNPVRISVLHYACYKPHSSQSPWIDRANDSSYHESARCSKWNQRDAVQQVFYCTLVGSTCFGCRRHPSSGAQYVQTIRRSNYHTHIVPTDCSVHIELLMMDAFDIRNM